MHEANAELPMLLTPPPIVTLIRLVQLANAEFPILVTLLGMVTLVRLALDENAELPMPVLVEPMELAGGGAWEL